MKSIIQRSLLFFALVSMGISPALARKITGVVYSEGKPAAGVQVSAHKSTETFFTSFDGKYEIEISDKSKYIKFDFPDASEKLDIEGKTEDVFDYYRGGVKPSEGGESVSAGEVDLRSQKELIAAKVEDYLTNYSMNGQYFKQKDYDSALKTWKVLYNKYPKSSENIYIRGVMMYDHFIANAKTAEEKKKFIEEEMAIYDQRAKYFGNSGEILGRKAGSLIQNGITENSSDSEKAEVYKQALTILDDAMKQGGDKTDARTLILTMQTACGMFKAGAIESDQIISTFDKTIGIADNNLKNDPTNEDYKTAQNAINQYFAISGAADCETLIKVYQPKIDASPDDIDLLKKVMAMLSRNECTDSDLFNKGAETLYQLEPNSQSALSMGQRFVKNGNIDKALEYFNESLNFEDADDDVKSRTSFMMAAVYMGKKHNLPKAREYARKALKFNPEMGEVYLLLGNIYAIAAPSIGGSDFEHQAVYWLACDYFAKATKYETVAANAASRLASFKQHFPDKNEVFFQGLQVGGSYKVGGWINETTKVRTR